MAEKTLFIGDVHGCSTELETMLLDVDPTRCILLGDIFRKGPSPLEVWDLIQDWNIEGVFGNHEKALLQKANKYPERLIHWVQELPLWIDGEYLSSEGLLNWRAVHAGVHPEDIEMTSPSQAINMRHWPSESDEDPFWWEVYTGKPLIIYGHDAKRGLQDHRPRTLGLDSGCVYGNGLTGYLLEEDRLIQISSKPYLKV